MQFDIDSYARRSTKVDTTDLDLDGGFVEQPLPEGAVRCLQYMHDIEFHTVCYLRDLLVTRAHSDPDVTTFLTMWNFEEYWHGDAIARVLHAHGRIGGAARVDALRRRLGWKDRARPMAFMLGSGVFRELPAIHMAWGAVNEWSAQAGYSLLLRKCDHPVLSELLKRIMRQEGRHVDFYASQAMERLERSAAARKLTRWALGKYWHPVGHGVAPEEETRFMVRYLFDGEAGRVAAERIDRNVDRFPGLDGLHLLEKAVRDYGVAA